MAMREASTFARPGHACRSFSSAAGTARRCASGSASAAEVPPLRVHRGTLGQATFVRLDADAGDDAPV